MDPYTVLVVEDDPNDESLTLRALRGLTRPCAVVVARSGGDALDYLLRRGAFDGRRSSDPHVVFLDNTLPGIPGNELVTLIRAEGKLRDVPLVVFSGTSDTVVIERCLASGASGFVEKPLDMGEYVSKLREAAETWLARA